MPDARPANLTREAQIVAAKIALDAARRLGDLLTVELAEDALNDLLDRSYHTYHGSKQEEQ